MINYGVGDWRLDPPDDYPLDEIIDHIEVADAIEDMTNKRLKAKDLSYVTCEDVEYAFWPANNSIYEECERRGVCLSDVEAYIAQEVNAALEEVREKAKQAATPHI